jgi:hypothetical protein
MKRTTLFYLSTISLILGSALIGWGIGKLFNKSCEGLLIGIGAGLLLNAMVSYRTHKKLLAFNKETV